MSARQLIVLAFAAIAAIGALFIIRSMTSRPAAPQEAAAPIAGENVLVAARDIAQGAALTPSDIGVALFPQNSVAPSFIRVSAQPSAQADYVNAVTRRAFARGEPITAESVVQPEGRGFMAAQLQPGYRAVSIKIEQSTAAGGFIQPNDHVDVIVTTRSSGGEGGEVINSNVALEDVRVLALGENTQTQASGAAPETIDASVAVLELTADDARLLALADQQGDISLALRGVQVDTVGLPTSGRRGGFGSSGAVRVHAFGSVSGGR